MTLADEKRILDSNAKRNDKRDTAVDRVWIHRGTDGECRDGEWRYSPFYAIMRRVYGIR